ncbi:unnamed protein product, partial [Phaeothamnion confervicola]
DGIIATAAAVSAAKAGAAGSGRARMPGRRGPHAKSIEAWVEAAGSAAAEPQRRLKRRARRVGITSNGGRVCGNGAATAAAAAVAATRSTFLTALAGLEEEGCGEKIVDGDNGGNGTITGGAEGSRLDPSQRLALALGGQNSSSSLLPHPGVTRKMKKAKQEQRHVALIASQRSRAEKASEGILLYPCQLRASRAVAAQRAAAHKMVTSVPFLGSSAAAAATAYRHPRNQRCPLGPSVS